LTSAGPPLPSQRWPIRRDCPRQAREHAARDKRLARALRENLHRRKQQARSKAQRDAEPAADPTPRRARRLSAVVLSVKSNRHLERVRDRIFIRGGAPLAGTIPIGAPKTPRCR